MKKLLVLALASLCVVASAADTIQTRHQDHRVNFPKLSMVDQHKTPTTLQGEDLTWHYLSANHERFGIQNPGDLVLDNVRQSLLGTHYTYRQTLMGFPVLDANIVISISHETGEVYRVYNNTFPTHLSKRVFDARLTLDSDEALDIAWHKLRVHGELLEAPTVEAIFEPVGTSFRLVYVTTIATEAPFGYWRTVLDQQGNVLKSESMAISRNRVDARFHDYNGPIWDRAETLARFEARQTDGAMSKALVAADGSGVVFDPDPVTTLQDDTLEDNSAASNFTNAYFTRTLRDLNFTGSTYELTGPWITIANFESPNVAPSTRSDGNWTGTRGDVSFNDAMTYFHIDQNQRYMQSLGFTGASGIQDGSIETDANGLSGADNSHFIPSSNRMAFGHGCVDDNEDAFVILHEYGHAIHFSINSNWSGGDTGGMGEGFGDYWGGSYRYSTMGGSDFHNEWAFPWDGHNNCWGGRIMNDTGQYNPSRSYGAHTTVDGVYSDQLWSSPLFQSLVRLDKEHGVAREELDQIILEAHFGIGSGPSMRDMATAIVATANSLYPSGPHATILTEEFELRNILEGGSNPGGQTDTFNSSVAGNGTNNHTITVGAGQISLNLSWNGGGDLDLRLYDAGNNLVASSTTKNNPETASYNASAGTYRIEVSNNRRKNKSYTLEATYQP